MSTSVANPTLFVSWRSPQTRLIYPVGRLSVAGSGRPYEFVYVQAVEKAVGGGFTAFPEFPDFGATYRSKAIFPLFSNRVMPTSRPGYADFLRSLKLPPDAEPMAILARTGGRRETDKIEMFPMPEPEGGEGCYTTHCLIRSIRYLPQPQTEERIARLQPGEPLYVMSDPQNPADPNAIAVRTEEVQVIGYVPAYLTTDLRLLKNECRELSLFVERVNPPPVEPNHRLLCKVVSCWPEGFRPFATDDFKPVSER